MRKEATISEWDVLIDSLFDSTGEGKRVKIPGPQDRVIDWLLLVQHDFDDVDRFYIDNETIGG